MSRRQPFADEPHAVVVLPVEDPTLGGDAGLLEHEKAGFEAELGTSVEISATDPGAGARWLLLLGGEPARPATITFDPVSARRGRRRRRPFPKGRSSRGAASTRASGTSASGSGPRDRAWTRRSTRRSHGSRAPGR